MDFNTDPTGSHTFSVVNGPIYPIQPLPVHHGDRARGKWSVCIERSEGENSMLNDYQLFNFTMATVLVDMKPDTQLLNI